MKFIRHHLTGMTRRSFLSAFMLFAMALCLNLPVEDAFAANRPQWVARKIKAWKIVRNNKVTSAGKPGYYVLQVEILHTNNSRDKIITAFYDKKGSFTVAAGGRNYVMTLNSVNVNRVSVYPGKSYSLRYNLPVTRATGGGTWNSANNTLRTNKRKITKWTYDLRVKAQGI